MLVFPALVPAQNSYNDYDGKDYKDRKSHEHFRKRRFAVFSWQITQLKQGALVVKLNTSQLLIDAFRKRGYPEEAERARLEQAAANLNIMRAYTSRYKFSKVYFIYSHSADSLLGGKRSGIFLDFDLRVDSSVTMHESFYLIAERDFAYNSSIGFVPEDSALKVTERGNPSASELPIVVKNKYGHQLKSPFPYSVNKVILSKGTPVVEMSIEGKSIPFTVRATKSRGGSTVSTYRINGKQMELILPRMFTYNVMCEVVDDFNAALNRAYRWRENPDQNSDEYQDNKAFFY